jgi:repressor LexA
VTTLTQRQQEVLAYLTDAIRRGGRPPTLREMAAHFGWRSDNSARQHLRLLRQKGVIEYDEGVSRGIRLGPTPDAAELRDVPLVGKVAAGVPLEAIENIEGNVGIDPSMFPETDVFALRVNGDSMLEAGIHDGDIALIRKTGEAADGDIVIALLNGEATLKRYLRTTGTVILRAENDAYRDIQVSPRDEFQIVGLAIGIIRRL